MITLQNGRIIDEPLKIKGKKIMNPYDFFSGADKIFTVKNGNFLKQLEPELINLLEYLAHSNDSNFLYFPFLKKVTGSTNTAILTSYLLQTIISLAKDNSIALLSVEFCKFLAPCDHPDYNKIGSWCEDLNFTKHECSPALKKIVFKTNRKTTPE